MTSSGNASARTKQNDTAGLGRVRGQQSPGSTPTSQWYEKLRDGTRILIRPIRKNDDALERTFLEGMSARSREYRFLGQMKVSDEMIRQMTDVDFHRDMALVAIGDDSGEESEIGVGRFYIAKDRASCECAVAVSDEWQRKGLGTLLMRHLIDIARQRGIKRMISIDMAENEGMSQLAASLGFKRRIEAGYPAEVIHTLELEASVSCSNSPLR